LLLRVALFISVVFGLLGLGGVAWLGTRAPTVQTVVQPIVPLAPPPVARPMIVVAAKPLRAGSLIKAEDLNVIETPADVQAADTIPGTRERRSELVGAMVRRSLQPNDPVLSGDVMLPGDRGFLAAVLSPGTRAATFAVDAASGANLIWPGDRVDVILTQSNDDASLPAGRRLTGETVLENLRVVAVDQAIVRGAVAGENAPQARTLTVEVTPEQAEKLAIAGRLGKVVLVVRPADKADDDSTPAPDQNLTYAADVSKVFSKDSGKAAILKVYSGATNGTEYKFQ